MNTFIIFTKPPQGYQPTAQIAEVSRPADDNTVMVQLWVAKSRPRVWVLLPNFEVDEIKFVQASDSVILAASIMPSSPGLGAPKLNGGR